MGRKVFSFLYRKTSNIHEAAFLLGLFALLSQVLAFLRDRLLAHIFGASGNLDTYYAAFRVPDFIFITVASIVSLSVLVPFIVEHEAHGRESVKSFINNIFSFFSVLIIFSCGLAFFFVPSLSRILFKGFSDAQLHEVILLSRIMLISPMALGFSNLLGSLTQAYNRFTIYAFAPLMYNASIILGIIVLGSRIGVMGVAIGVAVGACLHATIQIPFVIRAGLFPRLSLHFDFQAIKRVVALSLPRTLTLSTTSLAMVFLVSLASRMTEGSISILSFANNLQSVPLGIIGMSYSLATFPTLSRYFANKDFKSFTTQMATTAKHIIFWSLPVTSLFIVLRAQIVRVLLGTGRFDWNATRLTAAALAIFVISSVFQSLMLLFIRGFYSAGYTREPFFINLASVLVLTGSAYGLVHLFHDSAGFRYFVTAFMKVDDLPGTAVLMLPLGFSLGGIVNTLAHWVGFERKFRGFSREVSKTLVQSLLTSVVMGFVTYFGLLIFAPMFDTTSLPGIFLQGFLAGIAGIVSGVGVLYLLKSSELSEVWRAIHTKFWKSEVIATDPEIV